MGSYWKETSLKPILLAAAARVFAASLSASAAAHARAVRNGRIIVWSAAALIAFCLAFAPFLFSDVRAQQVAARICVFIVLAASYDLLIGYTGIVSFAHTMFFGLGAYGAAMALKSMGAGFDAIFLGGGAGVALAAVLAVAIGVLSLRVKAIFFAMVTLAAAGGRPEASAAADARAVRAPERPLVGSEQPGPHNLHLPPHLEGLTERRRP